MPCSEEGIAILEIRLDSKAAKSLNAQSRQLSLVKPPAWNGV